jgi:hypothetical protein
MIGEGRQSSLSQDYFFGMPIADLSDTRNNRIAFRKALVLGRGRAGSEANRILPQSMVVSFNLDE